MDRWIRTKRGNEQNQEQMPIDIKAEAIAAYFYNLTVDKFTFTPGIVTKTLAKFTELWN
jgi:hypothetical protein